MEGALLIKDSIKSSNSTITSSPILFPDITLLEARNHESVHTEYKSAPEYVEA